MDGFSGGDWGSSDNPYGYSDSSSLYNLYGYSDSLSSYDPLNLLYAPNEQMFDLLRMDTPERDTLPESPPLSSPNDYLFDFMRLNHSERRAA
jgi:hypothetical protein